MPSEDMAAVAKGKEAFDRAASVLDGQLKDRKFITGDTLTLADFSIGAAMNLADRTSTPMANSLPCRAIIASATSAI